MRKGHPGGAAVAVFAALNLLLPAQALAGPRIQPEEQYFVVGLRPSTDKPKAGDRLHGARVERVDRVLDFVRVSTRNPNVFRSRAKADPRVRYVEPDPELQLIEYTPNDPRFGEQYGPQHVRAPEAWDTTLGDLDASVCIVDSGVRYTHEEIAGSRWLGGHDFYNGDSDPNDDNGHGTHVATTAAGSIDNAKGIAGIANVGIFGVKVLSASGSGPWSGVASGIRWCADNGGPRVVISMSLGSGGTATVLEDAVKYAAEKGALQVAAAGNAGPCTNCIGFPARYPEVVAVTCTDSSKNQCSFSSDGPESELAGPGSGILAGWHKDAEGVLSDTAYNTISGTSMSTPHVSGTAALVWSHETALTAADLRQLLRDSSQDLGPGGWDELYGFGLVDAKATLDAAVGPPPPPPPVETTLSLENFDDGAANGWALTGMWRVTSACTTAASLPNHLVYNKASDCKYSNGTKRTTGTATFDADLTGSSVATLKFKHRWETESYLIGAFDVRRVLVSTDGGSTWSILQQWDSRYSNQLTWTAHSIDLDRFAGQPIKVRFLFDTVDGTSNGFAGWFLDDVEITGGVPIGTPVADAGPNQTVSDHDATGSETVTLDGTASTDPDGAITSYEWKEGETVVGTGATPSVDFGVGAHTVTLTVTDDDGATASDDVVVTVNANQDPTATFTATTSGGTADVDGSASSDPDGSIAGYTWDWGDGSPAGSGALATHTYASSGTYTVTLTVTDDGGATDVASQQVPIGTPVADAGPNQTVSDNDGTGSETVTLDGTSSTDPDGTITSYEWKEGDTVVATTATPSVDFGVGVHTVTLTVTDNDGVSDSDDVLITVNANQDPTATFTATTSGGTVDVDASASTDPDGSIAGYTWDWGDASPAGSGALATHTYGVSGTYTVTLTVTDNGGATDVASKQVTVGKPVADAGPNQTVSDHDGTGSETVTLDGTGSTDSDGTIASYEWKEGETVVGTGATPSVDFGVGAHTVTLTVTDDDGVTDSDNVLITVNANQDPTATFTATITGLTADVDGSASTDPDGSIAGYSWDWGDGSPTDSGATATHTFASPGAYTVTLTVTDNGGATDVASQQVVTGNESPVADAGPNQTVSDHDGTGSETVTLDGTASTDPDGTITSYEWKEGETVVATGATPSVDFGVGVHTVTLTVTDDDLATASDNVVITVEANQDPTATFTATTSGGSAEVDGTASSDPDGSIAGYAWDWGDGSPAGSGALATHTYGASGTYTVTLTVTDNGGATDVASKQVTVGTPAADAGPDQTVSDNDGTGSETVTLDGSGSTDPDGTITSYEWKEGETVVGTGATPSVDFGVGAHTVTLTVTDNDGATASDDVVITVEANQDPTAAFTATTSVLTANVDGSASTDPDGSIAGYTWDWGDGSPAGSGATAIHTYASSGTYTVTLTVTDDGGATDVASQQVTVSTTLLSQNFDSGSPPGWTMTGMWHVSSLCATAPSPPNYLGYNKDSDCKYSNRTNRTSGAATFDVDLTGKSQATLEFTHRWETENYSGGAFDVQRVQVSTNGGSTWTTLKQWDSRNPNQLTWTTFSQDLTAYANRPIKLRFFFDTMDAISNSYPGWFIDDVRVTAS